MSFTRCTSDKLLIFLSFKDDAFIYPSQASDINFSNPAVLVKILIAVNQMLTQMSQQIR